MRKQPLILLTAVTMLSATPAALAGPPEGKGPDSDMRGKKAMKDDARERMKKDREKEEAEEREEEAREQDEDERDEDAREKAEQERERAREEEEEGREEDDDEAVDDSDGDKAAKGKDKGKQDMPPGLKKKDGAPQAGKGSETGQQKREENSRAWWKFWGDDEE